MTEHPVFFDPDNRRAGQVSRVAWASAIISTLLGVVFVSSLLVLRTFPATPATSQHQRYALLKDAVKVRHLLPVVRRLAAKAQLLKRGIPRSTHPTSMPVTPRKQASPQITRPGKPLTIAFYVNWDEASYDSLKRNLLQLDWVVPSWLSLQGTRMDLKVNLDPKSLDLMRRIKPSTKVLAMLQNSTEDAWDGPGLAQLLANPGNRHARLQEIVSFVETNGLQGIVVDFEQIPNAAHKDVLAFLGEAHEAFKARGWIVAVAAPFDDPEWNYRAYARVTDFLMLMGYDQHWSTGTPGSIAAQSWFTSNLAKRMKELDPAHTIVAVGNYGYDWPEGEAGDDTSFQETMLAARDAKAAIDFDPETLNPRYSYTEDGKTHRVWLLDAVTAYNQLRAADKLRPAGYALWRLGSEDPSIWPVLTRNYDAPPPEALRDIAPASDVEFIGQGELLQIAAEPAPGARTFALDAQTGTTITTETYTKIPTSFTIRRAGEAPGKVALTFDDGPDPQWTPAILDVLKAKGVRATFFVIGENGAAHPRLLQRVAAEGHDLGNHTFTHPNLGETPDEITRVELNATQRLIEALTGRSTRLFRPPYLGDNEPSTPTEIAPLQVAEELGYLTVGLKVDPDDWQQPPADQIVARVLAQINDPDPEKRGQIVLLHDGGGDRSQTLAALPALIDALHAKGITFVTVSELAGWSKDQAMPPVPSDDALPFVDRFLFYALSFANSGLTWLFLLAIGLGLARLIVLCGLALFDWRRSLRRTMPAVPHDLSVSVLIPAYNEAKVIATSIRQVLHSAYPYVEIIVIDDGSKDGTSNVVRQAFSQDPRVTLLTTPNGGKAKAINIGLARAKGDVIVVLDADTQFEPLTISRLLRWFGDPQIGAVAGNAKVGNRVNTLTRWQALEYITAQNLERRALAALGCITVVPGAVGAWRREALTKLGGFPADTLAEDQDLTIMIQRAGYKVVFDPEAIAWTEAPDTRRGLAKQRFRWAFGTLQCLWKHRDATFDRHYGALGLVALPQVWLFQIALALVSPLVDVLLIVQIVRTVIDYLQHGEQFNPENLWITAFYYALFMAVDLSAAAIGFVMEKNEDKSLLWWLILQRFGYRQIMYYVVVKSVVTAVQGRFVGWGKLERKATVTSNKI